MIMLLSDKIHGWGIEFHQWLTRPNQREIRMWTEGQAPEAIYRYRQRTGLGLRKAFERMDIACLARPRKTPDIFQAFHFVPPTRKGMVPWNWLRRLISN